MNVIVKKQPEIELLVLHQLENFFCDLNENVIKRAIPTALACMEENFIALNDTRYFNGKDILFNPYHSVTWTIFLYRLSHELGTNISYRKMRGGEGAQGG